MCLLRVCLLVRKMQMCLYTDYIMYLEDLWTYFYVSQSVNKYLWLSDESFCDGVPRSQVIYCSSSTAQTPEIHTISFASVIGGSCVSLRPLTFDRSYSMILEQMSISHAGRQGCTINLLYFRNDHDTSKTNVNDLQA